MMKSRITLSFLLFLALGGLTLDAQESTKLRTNGKIFTHTQRTTLNKSSGCPDSEFRTIDGTCNNRKNGKEEWGASDIALYRTMNPEYGTADIYNAMGGESRVTARAISNAVSAQTGDTPSAAGLSSFVFTWGQFLDHDIDLTPEDHIEYEPIEMPSDEPLFTSAIPFFRSAIHDQTGTSHYRQQINLITSYIDASNVYGSDQLRADWLRSFIDGKLKVSDGNLLPYNTIDGESASDIDINAPSMAGDNGGTNKTFVAGDIRAAEQPGLTSMHTLFVRHHNRICDRLIEDGMTDDEEIYQVARKEVGAIIQAITYNEFLPALGISLRKSRGYNDRARADISNIFATATYRLGHTMVTDELLLKGNECQDVDDGSISLLEGFFNPAVVAEYNIDPILKGLSVQVQNEVDTKIIDNLRNFLFGDPSSGNAAGLDLASLNIQRGRDHGLPHYNAVRKKYTGKSAKNFGDITKDAELRAALQDVYNDVDNIDLWVGLLAEDKVPGTSLGKTLHKLLESQFEKLRSGDRYFYLHDRYLRKKDRERIHRTRLSDIIEANTSLTNLQKNVFRAKVCSSNLFADETLNRSKIEEERIDVYPNPAQNVLYISTPLAMVQSNQSAKISIQDAAGVIFRVIETKEENISVNISALPVGTYLVRIESGDHIMTRKFVKVKS